MRNNPTTNRTLKSNVFQVIEVALDAALADQGYQTSQDFNVQCLDLVLDNDIDREMCMWKNKVGP